MLAVIVDDNKQAALDLAERLREFEDVEVGGMAINGMMDCLLSVRSSSMYSFSMSSCPICRVWTFWRR